MRTFWWVPDLGRDFRLNDGRKRVPLAEANLVASTLQGEPGKHMPVIDLDVPHYYVPSSTEGHGHLYIDTRMSWRKYERILRALAEADVLGWAEYVRALDRGATFARLPGTVRSPRGPRMDTGDFVKVFAQLWARALWRETKAELSTRWELKRKARREAARRPSGPMIYRGFPPPRDPKRGDVWFGSDGLSVYDGDAWEPSRVVGGDA